MLNFSSSSWIERITKNVMANMYPSNGKQTQNRLVTNTKKTTTTKPHKQTNKPKKSITRNWIKDNKNTSTRRNKQINKGMYVKGMYTPIRDSRQTNTPNHGKRFVTWWLPADVGWAKERHFHAFSSRTFLSIDGQEMDDCRPSSGAGDREGGGDEGGWGGDRGEREEARGRQRGGKEGQRKTSVKREEWKET